MAYTVVAGLLLHRPQRIKNEWPNWSKRLAAGLMVAIGCCFVFLSVYGAITGHCLGTNLNSSN